jgi:transketolase C-terminal domain/subunit
VRFKRIALPDVNVCKVGSQEWLRAQYGLSPQAIAETIKNTLK